MRLHHVQVACPPDGEAAARRFYGECLGMTEIDKPGELATRGGCWFRTYDDAGSVLAEIHVGVEEPFSPARKAHPALVLGSVVALEVTASRLAGAGYEVDWSQRATLPGYERFHTFDGAGNRVEILTAVAER